MSDRHLVIDLRMENAAFEGEDAGPEAAAILRKLADKLQDRWELTPGDGANLFDVNGNTVGEWKVVTR